VSSPVLVPSPVLVSPVLVVPVLASPVLASEEVESNPMVLAASELPVVVGDSVVEVEVEVEAGPLAVLGGPVTLLADVELSGAGPSKDGLATRQALASDEHNASANTVTVRRAIIRA